MNKKIKLFFLLTKLLLVIFISVLYKSPVQKRTTL